MQKNRSPASRSQVKYGNTIVFVDSLQQHNRSESGINLLPTRPQRTKALKPVKIITNLFELCVPNGTFFHSIEYDIEPFPCDDRKLLWWMVDSLEASLTTLAGTPPIRLGRKFYTWKKLPIQSTVITFQHEGHKYVCTVTQGDSVPWSDLFSNIDELRKVPLNLLNALLQRCMKRGGYQQVLNSNTFYHKNSIQSGGSIFLHHGYRARFVTYQHSAYLLIDPIRKVFRERTVLECLDDIYIQYQSESREYKRALVCDLVRGKLVVANYGDRRVWRVDGVCFDGNASIMSAFVGSTECLLDYYQRRYGVTIQKPTQPMLLARTNNKQTVVLISELFCFLENANAYQNSKHLRSEEIYNRINNIRNLSSQLIQQKTNNESLSTLLSAMNISVNPYETHLEGESMDAPLLQAGQQIEQSKIYKFWMKDRSFYKQSADMRLLVIFPEGSSDAYSFILDVANSMRLRMCSQSCELRSFNLLTIKEELQNRLQKYAPNAMLVLLSAHQKEIYVGIKEYAAKLEIATQFLLQSSLLHNGRLDRSVASAVLCQLAGKMGALPWVVKCQGSCAMMVALWKTRCAGGRIIITICANTTPGFTRYFSKFRQQDEGSQTACITQLFGEALQQYQTVSGGLPHDVVLLQPKKNSEADWTDRVGKLLQVIQQQSTNEAAEPRLTFIHYNTNPVETFLHHRTCGDLENSHAGTLVRRTIVGRHYDFYIASGLERERLNRPTHYNVIYTSARWEDDRLERLLYSQCFNYVGISGVSCMPAVCRYAKKLARFVSKFEGNVKPQFDAMNHQLFYL